VHISASTNRLLAAAELMELRKPCIDGTLREFSLAEVEHYKGSGQQNTVNPLFCENIIGEFT
jgi:hypothetical protein